MDDRGGGSSSPPQATISIGTKAKRARVVAKRNGRASMLPLLMCCFVGLNKVCLMFEKGVQRTVQGKLFLLTN
jgi:hypothetical protein